MRNKIVIGLGATTAVIALSTGGAALAASAAPHQQAHVAIAAAAHKITKAQARQIALKKVPHSRVIEIESDDRHDRAVWKVTLATKHGRVIVDVDKKTGKATIVRHSGHGDGGHGDSAGARALSEHRTSGHDSARDAREDRGEHRRDDRGEHRRDDRGDRRHHEGRHHHGDRHDHDGADG
jgi:hypothetical protein